MRSTRWAVAILVLCGVVATGTSPAMAAPPPNDNFESATALGSGTSVAITGTNVDATSQAGENNCCWVYNSVWYRWTAPKTGNYRLEVCGSGFNTHVKVLTGTTVNALQTVAESDNDPGCGPDGTRSRLTFIAGAGQEYKFQIGSQVSGQTGTISGSLALVSPPNDFFADVAALEGATASIDGTNVDATTESGEDSCCWVYNSVWYRWTAPKTGNYRLELCDSSFNTHVKVLTGTAVNALQTIADNDDYPSCGPDGRRSQLTFVAGAGQEYKIQLGSHVANQTGTFSGSLALVSPPNDFFADATDLGAASSVPISGKNVDASTEAGEPTCCSTSATVWYRWTAPAAGSYRVETCGSDFRTYVKVLQGSAVNALASVAENSGASGCGPAGDRAETTFNAGTNSTYYIQIGSASEPRGNISGSISPVAAPPPPPPPPGTDNPALISFPGALPPASKPPVTGGAVHRRKGKYVLRIKGRFKLPPGLTPEQACNGTMIYTIKRGKRLITARTGKLTSKCTYSKTVRIARSKLKGVKRLGLTVRFSGNKYLSFTERNYRVRVKR